MGMGMARASKERAPKLTSVRAQSVIQMRLRWRDRFFFSECGFAAVP
jgi:hypothetical protein